MFNKSKENGSTTQGVETAPKTPPDLETIKEWLKRDTSIALSLLSAIHSDPNLQHEMALWFHGKFLNDFHKPKSSDLFPEG